MDSYHVRLRGRCIGPYTLDRIRHMTRKGEVGRSHEVSTDGISWAPATTFPEIFERPVESAGGFVGAVRPIAPIDTAPAPSPTPAPHPVSVQVESQWYRNHGGTADGPMPRSQLIAMIQRGEVAGSDFVFQEGTPNWVLAIEAPELAAAFPAAAAGGTALGITAFCRECGGGVSPKALMCPKCGAPTGVGEMSNPATPFQVTFPTQIHEPRRSRGEPKSKIVAAVLALVVGGLGAHHFYLGNPVMGIVYLLFCWTLVPAVAAFIEAIMYLSMSDAAFDQKYNA